MEVFLFTPIFDTCVFAYMTVQTVPISAAKPLFIRQFENGQDYGYGWWLGAHMGKRED